MAQIAALLPEGTVLITGAVRAPECRPATPIDARLQFDLRDRPRRLDPVGLRQGPSGAVRRISAVSGSARKPRPDAAHQGAAAASSPATAAARMSVPRAPRMLPLICYEIIFPGEAVPRGERPGWMLNLTNDGWFGLAPAPISTCSRRGCGRSSRDCRWCARPIPAFRR